MEQLIPGHVVRLLPQHSRAILLLDNAEKIAVCMRTDTLERLQSVTASGRRRTEYRARQSHCPCMVRVATVTASGDHPAESSLKPIRALLRS